MFVDGHAKWLRVASTLSPNNLWVDESEPDARTCVANAYMLRLRNDVRTRTECLD